MGLECTPSTDLLRQTTIRPRCATGALRCMSVAWQRSLVCEFALPLRVFAVETFVLSVVLRAAVVTYGMVLIVDVSCSLLSDHRNFVLALLFLHIRAMYV